MYVLFLQIKNESSYWIKEGIHFTLTFTPAGFGENVLLFATGFPKQGTVKYTCIVESVLYRNKSRFVLVSCKNWVSFRYLVR